MDPTQLEPARGRGFPAWHSMRITLLRGGLDDRAWERARNLFGASRLVVRGENGRRSHQETGPRQNGADGVAVTVRSPADVPDPWLGPPAHGLAIDVPSRAVEVDVPFLFEDIALPEAKKAAPK
jgi:hypothetical protein